MGGRFGDVLKLIVGRASCNTAVLFWVGSRYYLFWILVVLIRMQTSFAMVVSGVGLNVKQRTYSSGACATEYYSCSHSLLRPGMKFGAVVKLFNYISVKALVTIRSL